MRKFISFLLPAAVMATGVILITSSTSCRKNTVVSSSASAADTNLRLSAGVMAGLPGPVYASQASSSIQWQSWTPGTFALAKKMNRLVLAVIVMPQQSGYQNVLRDLGENNEIAANINSNYVPVLVDADASREMQMISKDLCFQLKKSVQFPLFLWLTPEGNPLGWLPIQGKTAEVNAHTFKSIETVVSDMRNSGDGYIEKNSLADQKMRRERVAKANVPEVSGNAPELDALSALRELISLYDVGSRSLDNAGSFVPISAIDALAAASLLPGVPADLAQRSKQTTSYLLEDYLGSPIFDPLDGGVYSTLQGRSPSLPNFERNTIIQARMAIALFHAYAATSNPLALERAMGCIDYAERTGLATDGLFTYGSSSAVTTESWLWKTEDLERLLGPEDAAWWGKLTGTQSVGNIPLDVDTKRDYFRMNVLALKKPLAVLVKESGLPEGEFRRKFDKIRQSLLTEREKRQGTVTRDKDVHAGASLRMASAYAAAYTATGDRKFVEKATRLIDRARTTFSMGEKLFLYRGEHAPSLVEGRAFLYALAIQSALDVADVSGDLKQAKWAEELAATTSRLFVEGGYVKECPATAAVMDLPVADWTMLADDSTAGLLSEGLQRLKGRGLAVPENPAPLVTRFPKDAVVQPILHSDFVLAALIRNYSPAFLIGDQAPENLAHAVAGLPLRLVSRRLATAEDQVPQGTLKLVRQIGENAAISTPEAVREALLPSP